MGGKKGGSTAADPNSKKAQGNAKKAESAARKEAVAAAAREREEETHWSKGAKDAGKKQAAEDKKAEQAAKKAEAKRLLAEEEASQPSKPKGAGKKVAEKKTRGTLDLGQLDDNENNNTGTLNASGIDNALDALSLTTSSNEIKIDRHPERRKEAAYKAYAEWRDEELKEEGLGRSQRIQRMRQEFEKRPENPLNQANAGHYAASKTDMAGQRESIRAATEDRLAQPNRGFGR